jgi:dethiobiotin synthetase
MKDGFFITGTDTGIGKTVFTTLAVAALRDSGVNCAPIKPVQTGGIPAGDRLSVPDLEFVLQGSGLEVSEETKKLLCPVCYRKPASPHLAAAVEGEQIDPERILDSYQQLCGQFDCLAVEGAGGIMVPITEEYLMLDLMVDLNLPVILVARPNLGTINHTLLSIAALREAELEIGGVVFNETRLLKQGDIERDNRRIIAKLGEIDVLGTISHIPGLQEIINGEENIWHNKKVRAALDFDLQSALL